MNLINDLYKVIESKSELDSFEYLIKLNPSHKIYLGHYPGHPITPGVIQIAIVEELCGLKLNQKLKLSKITTCKFIGIINPIENPIISLSIILNKIDDVVFVLANISHLNDEFFKLKSEYEIIH